VTIPKECLPQELNDDVEDGKIVFVQNILEK